MIHSRGWPNVVKVKYNFLLIWVDVLENKHMKQFETSAQFTVTMDIVRLCFDWWSKKGKYNINDLMTGYLINLP